MKIFATMGISYKLQPNPSPMWFHVKNISPWHSFNEFFVSVVYFVQGAGGLTAIASSLILKEELGLDFYQIGLIGVASTLPWSIKPIFGILTDLVPINNLRRRPYLHIGPLLAFLGFFLIAFYGFNFQTFFLALILANIGLALTDVATDGFVVEESTKENTARLQGITQASIRVAAFLTSFFSGLLIFEKIVTPHGMYTIMMFFPLLTFIASFFLKEKPADAWKLFEPDPENSIAVENTLEQYQSRKLVLQIFSPAYISSLIVVFALVMGNIVFGDQVNEWLSNLFPWHRSEILTTLIWSVFAAWMLAYFLKLKRMNLTTGMIFLAILFILLWRTNPGAGSSMFFYIKDTLGVNTKTLGFIDTIAQVGSILGVILAVKVFDKIPMKKLLLVTVLIAAAYGFTSFAITRPDYANWIGAAQPFSLLGTLIAIPVYFFDSLFSFLFTSGGFADPIAAATSLTAMEKFLYVQSIIGELIFMIAYIPLLKFAVLITPKRAEATNYSIIASIMNIGLAISAWLSGYLYNNLMLRLHPDLEITSIQVDVIEILIWVNIITSLMCLLVLPFLKTKEFVKE